MIRKSGNRFSLATNAKRVCAEIMLKQRDEIMMRFHAIASCSNAVSGTRRNLQLDKGDPFQHGHIPLAGIGGAQD
jgi:hypothetical protein